MKLPIVGGVCLALAVLLGCGAPLSPAQLPVERAQLTYAPNVPPPLTRKTPAIIEVHLEATETEGALGPGERYFFWGFNGQVPGPMIRARVGDTLAVHVTNAAAEMPHNIDFHAVTGPGGGATVLTVSPGETAVGYFLLRHPGLFVYHCAAPPVPDHIANGMYGLILAEPKEGLPTVDREFYVLQSEFYTTTHDEIALKTYDRTQGVAEHPRYVVFNGKVGSLLGEGALKANVGEAVRIYFGNGGPNLISSFHIIGEIFDRVYREASLTSPPATDVQTTLVPPGGATIVDFGVEVPGTYTLVDHAIFRLEKGAVGYLQVAGEENPHIFTGDPAKFCPGCEVHP